MDVKLFNCNDLSPLAHPPDCPSILTSTELCEDLRGMFEITPSQIWVGAPKSLLFEWFLDEQTRGTIFYGWNENWKYLSLPY